MRHPTIPMKGTPATSGTPLDPCVDWIPGLDGLRAIAIVWVIVSHLHLDALLFPTEFLAHLAGAGVHGVTLFFVISGFLISTLLLREESSTGKIRLGSYYRRRAFRILPAAVAYLAVTLTLLWWMGGVIDPGEWLGSLLFYRNLISFAPFGLTGHFWSLSVEEQFYLVWPALLVFWPKRHRLSATFFLVLAAPLWRHLMTKVSGGGPLMIGRLDLIYDSLVMGALLAQLQVLPWFRGLFDRARYPGAWLLLGIAGFLYLSIRKLPFGTIGVMASGTAQLLCAALAIKVLIEGRCPPAQAVLGFPAVAGLGKLSYSLYLWHMPFMLPWIPAFPGDPAVRVLLSLVAAWISYRCIERPALRLRSALMDSPRHPSEARH